MTAPDPGDVYETGDPDVPPPHGLPLCPVCGTTDRPPRLELRHDGPGIVCLDCDTVFSGEPGEMSHPDNQRRRALLAEERRNTPAPADVEHPLAERARDIAARGRHGRKTA